MLPLPSSLVSTTSLPMQVCCDANDATRSCCGVNKSNGFSKFTAGSAPYVPNELSKDVVQNRPDAHSAFVLQRAKWGIFKTNLPRAGMDKTQNVDILQTDKAASQRGFGRTKATSSHRKGRMIVTLRNQRKSYTTKIAKALHIYIHTRFYFYFLVYPSCIRFITKVPDIDEFPHTSVASIGGTSSRTERMEWSVLSKLYRDMLCRLRQRKLVDRSWAICDDSNRSP